MYVCVCIYVRHALFGDSHIECMSPAPAAGVFVAAIISRAETMIEPRQWICLIKKL